MVFWLHTSTVPLKVYTSSLQVCIVYTLITWVCATLPWGIHHSDKSASVSQAPTSSLQVYINTRGSSVASSPVIWLSSEIPAGVCSHNGSYAMLATDRKEHYQWSCSMEWFNNNLDLTFSQQKFSLSQLAILHMKLYNLCMHYLYVELNTAYWSLLPWEGYACCSVPFTLIVHVVTSSTWQQAPGVSFLQDSSCVHFNTTVIVACAWAAVHYIYTLCGQLNGVVSPGKSPAKM